jgi:hypothetical protein
MKINSRFYVENLQLKPHPEGGYFREVYKSDEIIAAGSLPGRYEGPRSFATSIYYLLEGDQVSKFHRLKSDEIWHFYDGSSIRIFIINDEKKLSEIILGKNIAEGELFQFAISRGSWFSAEVTDKASFSLIGCTVAPGFEFADFETGIDEKLLISSGRFKESLNRFR